MQCAVCGVQCAVVLAGEIVWQVRVEGARQVYQDVWRAPFIPPFVYSNAKVQWECFRLVVVKVVWARFRHNVAYSVEGSANNTVGEL